MILFSLVFTIFNIFVDLTHLTEFQWKNFFKVKIQGHKGQILGDFSESNELSASGSIDVTILTTGFIMEIMSL